MAGSESMSWPTPDEMASAAAAWGVIFVLFYIFHAAFPHKAGSVSFGPSQHRTSLEGPIPGIMSSPSTRASSTSSPQTPDVRSSRERAALHIMQNRVRQEHAAGRGLELRKWAHAAAETEDRMLLRFLRARNLNVDKAMAMLCGDVEWRRETAVETLANMHGDEVLGRPVAELWRHFPSWWQGFDVAGRPVKYVQW